MNFGIPEESIGPTITFHPEASSISPLRRAAFPGIMSFLCLTLSSIPDFFKASATLSAVSFLPATALSTAIPSVSTTRR